MHLYPFFRSLFRGIFASVYRWRVIGRENIPDGEGIVLCANHISNWDPVLLGCGIERQVHFMAKQELFKVPVLSWLIRNFGAFPVKRGAGDRQAIRKSLEVVNQGKVLGIFPEGRRNRAGAGDVGKVLPGAAMIALKAGVRVVPVAIIGPYRLFRPITIIYGKPIDIVAEVAGKESGERTQYAAEVIRREIQALMDIHKKRA
ncbi:lysophospholipid acyltransferase family protein [Aneurinibacillus thermoaerophilus]|uniref:1-acyl-sn-glycerol-3-phosphate acyltransferase n=1 Tax=Aneurinibacillus thermoaerophilus TaxID=143495 RepID=A0ABX8YGL8_ANETH|nr:MULTISPECIES: lysophospholipid acyltransferase family protein [Aneurinibacillus]AMA74741.1 acyl-phosphate glycerol 3-phosphate acyltransferase [Aneurinibacillus sp. XH2]MED0674988.1 lysophospholipid acyltransferase family protein [Aneurinibacillus thermoaerophilus]QYY44495.1 1-acyl-sn-glycerol-3-phosphate acyltransferase [Aneurinibacillus thermoaerophilus]